MDPILSNKPLEKKKKRKSKEMIRGGGGKSSGYSADLMVCFPSRTQLSLPSKQICSPSSSHSFSRRQNAPHHRRSISKLSGSTGVRQNRDVEEIAEPTSPKVTCAGQIKVRPSKRDGGTKNWQSLMAEIEKIHKSKSESKFFGIKKDVMGFLTCLRDLRFDFRCFGAFPPVDLISDDDDEQEEEEEGEGEDEDESSGGTVFSKWFMVVHEKQNNEECMDVKENTFLDAETAVPPPNALLLMRCRSAPVKNWLELEEKKKEETEEYGKRESENTEKQSEEEEEKETVRKKKDLRSLMEEENTKNLMVMSYDTNYYKLSSDIAKETWVVGGIQDPLSRSRSWKK